MAKNQTKFKINTQVYWKWMGRQITGVVKDVYLRPVEKVIKGKKIKRKGSIDKPAYLVQSSAGNLALKLHSELFLKDESSSTACRVVPSIFSDEE